MARFEVFILNYNGVHFLKECIDSLRAIDLGNHQLGINVVDNGSTDISQKMIENNYPSVNFIALGNNFGFSKGNNLGVRRRIDQLKRQGQKADFFIFLNNDTKVERQWLLEAAKILESNPQIGMVGSKSVFYDRFAVLEISASPTFCPADYGAFDTRELSCFLRSKLQGANIFVDFRRSKLLHAYPEEGPLENRGRWLPANSKIFVGIHDHNKNSRVSLTLENQNPGRKDLNVVIKLSGGSEKLISRTISFDKSETISFSLTPANYLDVIQNAGSYINASLEGGDRGFLEVDEGQYDAEFTPDAICGVSCFIRADLFKKLNGFDEHYFAYYEDTDLSLRAKANGYQLRYAPRSVLRHIHCGSGVEFSDYFNENVTYSHLIFCSKFMPGPLWKKKLTSCINNAKREFNIFFTDGVIGNKPHLRAYCRYLKKFLYFNLNRVLYYKHRIS